MKQLLRLCNSSPQLKIGLREVESYVLEDDVNPVLTIDSILFGILQRKTLFSKDVWISKCYFWTSETFRITNIQIQFVPSEQSRREEKMIEIIVFYFEVR